MTENKICPIMSKPDQTDKEGFESEQEMKNLGWYPSHGHPWGNVFPCQNNKCMAWVDSCPLIDKEGMLPEICLKYEGTNIKCHRNRRVCEAYCKLIEGGS
jgi:hypothetical protein